MGLRLASLESLDSELFSPVLTEYHRFLDRHDLKPHAQRFRPRHSRSQTKVSIRHGRAAPTPRLASHTATRKHQPSDVEEDIALARSYDVRLPGEGRRPPSLERQDAFRDGTTVKRKRPHVSAMQRGDPSDEELYRRGILYDDEYLRGELFSLGEISHDAPVWNVRYRAPRPRGRTAQRRGDRKATFEELKLALSFARLGDDEDIRGLSAPKELPLLDYGITVTQVEAVEEAAEVTVEEHAAQIQVRILSLKVLQTAQNHLEDGPPPADPAKFWQPLTLDRLMPPETKSALNQEENYSSHPPNAESTADQRALCFVTALGLDGKRFCQTQMVDSESPFENTTQHHVLHNEDSSNLTVAHFEHNNHCPAQQALEAAGDEHDDWAFLDDMEGADSDDATIIASPDAEPDDTWIMLGSPGS